MGLRKIAVVTFADYDQKCPPCEASKKENIRPGSKFNFRLNATAGGQEGHVQCSVHLITYQLSQLNHLIWSAARRYKGSAWIFCLSFLRNPHSAKHAGGTYDIVHKQRKYFDETSINQHSCAYAIPPLYYCTNNFGTTRSISLSWPWLLPPLEPHSTSGLVMVCWWPNTWCWEILLSIIGQFRDSAWPCWLQWPHPL